MSGPLISPLRIAAFTLLLVLTTVPVLAQPTLTWIENVAVTDLSSDGHVATGYVMTTLDAFRWTEAGGLENIGGSSAYLGIGAAEPRITAGGSRICATIAAVDSTNTTQGLWTRDTGWQDLLPPFPENGIVVDNNMGSAWGISGDGTTVVGLSWFPPAQAHATAWTEAGGIVDLGSQGGDSRANSASQDGSVVVGWSSDTTTGSWQPTVWENGGMTVLSLTEASGQAFQVTPDGQMIVGQALKAGTTQSEAALFFRDAGEPTGWSISPLGFLPGTSEVNGSSMAQDAAQDGSIVIGLNYYSTFSRVYFVWTPTLGMMTADQYMDQLGISMPNSFQIERLSAVSDDGGTLSGYGFDLYQPGTTVSFIIDLGGVSDVPDAGLAGGFDLEPNWPNPFNPSTSLALNLDRGDRIQLVIHDARGRVVRRLHEGTLPKGRHTWIWNGRNDGGMKMASGVYLAVVTDGNGTSQSQRMTLVK